MGRTGASSTRRWQTSRTNPPTRAPSSRRRCSWASSRATCRGPTWTSGTRPGRASGGTSARPAPPVCPHGPCSASHARGPDTRATPPCDRGRRQPLPDGVFTISIRDDIHPSMAKTARWENQALWALSEQLAAVGAHFELVVVGGSALVALGLVERATRDVDVLGIL